jgi:CRISPR-associated protein Csb1
MSLSLEKLQSAVANAAAMRRVRKLQPTGGPGDKIFPPTYPAEGRNGAPRHVFETRRINGQNVLCVLIDSVQSQANRLEEALKDARDSGAFAFPLIAVDFKNTELADIGRVTTLDAPHRVFDAIIRDSELDGVLFRETSPGRALIEAKSQNARAVYELSPAALIFGAWNSTGEGGGLGAKFPRCIVSEIVGVGVATEPYLRTNSRTGELLLNARTGEVPQEDRPSGKRPSSRIDPLGIVSGVKVYKKAGTESDWTVMESEAEQTKQGTAILYSGKRGTGKAGRPSLINHGNVKPDVDQLGVSVDYAVHNFVLSFAALRRLRFGTPNADLAAQTVLAVLGLLAVTAQDRFGYFLRSRCDLVPEQGSSRQFEVIDSEGRIETVDLDATRTSALAAEAAKAAAAVGLKWAETDLILTPQNKLVQIVLKSRELALAGQAEPEVVEPESSEE